jgi:3-oxoacyl-[acyl-carrier-protein] synthase-3
LKDVSVKHAAIGPIALHFPARVETNDELAAAFPKWDMERIYEKTGIRQRYVAEPEECASDLAVAAAEKLLHAHEIDRTSIDYLLLCTQTPDYPLPTTACLLQHRLKLPNTTGALDFNLGCSGFVYGLSMAQGLIASGQARRVLLITAETYSKYIDDEDRSLRTIFSDAAAATLIEASSTPSLGPFTFGTDGAEADTLMVNQGGARQFQHALKPRKRHRWASQLFMDGPSLVTATLERVPPMMDALLAKAGLAQADIDYFLMHQATLLMLDRLRAQLQVGEDRLPTVIEQFGNTVSSTIPIVIHDLRRRGLLRPGTRSMLVGFGVGFSWSGAIWTETWPGA